MKLKNRAVDQMSNL